MLSLPPSNKIWLRSFSIAVGITGATLIASILFVLDRSFVLATPVLVVAIAVTRPEIIVKPYNLWNRIARRLERFVRFALLVICYYVIVLPVSVCGSRVVKRAVRDNVSLWAPRGTLPPNGYSSQYTGTALCSLPDDRSIMSYLRWAASTKNGWAIFLTPFLLLIQLLDPEHEAASPASTYTLF
jgi:hypothetical protein